MKNKSGADTRNALNHCDKCGTWITPKLGQGTICLDCKPIVATERERNVSGVTPTPWVYQPYSETIRSEKENYWLATMNSFDGAVDNKANAEFIVRAVNSFDAMKVALEAVKRGTEPYSGYIMTMVNQALNKAEKGA